MTEEDRARSEEYARKATLLTKHMASTDKYRGGDDNFDVKFKVFLAKCIDVGLTTSEAIAAVFHHLLDGEAQEHHFQHHHRRGLTAAELIERTKTRFQTEERLFKLGREWSRMSLKRLLADNPEKSVNDVFDDMVTRLRRLQAQLPLQQGDERLREALLNATIGVPAVSAARLKPTKDVEGLISDFQGAIAEWDAQNEKTTADTMYVDRRFNNNPGRVGRGGSYNMTPKSARPSYPRRQQGTWNQDRGTSRGNRGGGRGVYRRQGGNNERRQGGSDLCHVCRKAGCRSWKHPQNERMRSAMQFMTEALEEEEYDDEDAGAEDQEKEEGMEAAEGDNDEDDGDWQGNQAYFSQLTDMAAYHVLTSGAISPPARYGDTTFAGILVDTGANFLSTAGKAQYEAYCKSTGVTPSLAPSTAACRYGMGDSKALGAATILFPFASDVFSTVFHIMDADIPFLLCLTDMTKLGVYCNNLRKELVHQASGRKITLTEDNGHLWIRWNPVVDCLLTDAEIRRIHRRFGHASAQKLYELLNRADRNEPGLKRTLEAIEKECEHCQRNAQAPRRFKFAFHDGREFNHIIYVDICYIRSRPVLHVVDEATKYQAARWLPSISAKDAWDCLRACWIDVYIGPPDIIAHDAGRQFAGGEFQAAMGTLRIEAKPIPIESPQSMAVVERYHASLRKAYETIASEQPTGSPELLLQTAVKAVNDSVGPDGLIPTLLVYGALPRLGLPTDQPAPATYKRAAALRKATEELSRANAKRQVSEALAARNGPDLDQYALRPGLQALLWRRNSRVPAGRWEGPFTIVAVEDETVTLLLPSGPLAFRSTAVRPLITAAAAAGPVEEREAIEARRQQAPERPFEQLQPATNAPRQPLQQPPQASREPQRALQQVLRQPQQAPERPLEQLQPAADASGQPQQASEQPPLEEQQPPLEGLVEEEDNTAFLSVAATEDGRAIIYLRDVIKDDPERFRDARAAEIQGLVARGTFTIVNVEEAEGHRIYGGRFHDEIKNAGTAEAFEKSRFVVQGFHDRDHGLLTHVPTVHRASIRLLLAVAAQNGASYTVFGRDVSQAYLQSTTQIIRKIFVRPPPELGLPPGCILLVNRALYGIAESGMHWFETYHGHHVKVLGMKPAAHDPCLLYLPGATKSLISKDFRSFPSGVTCLQTDDTINAGDEVFRKREEEGSRRFQRKERELLRPDTPLGFNGMTIEKREDEAIYVHQQGQLSRLKELPEPQR